MASVTQDQKLGVNASQAIKVPCRVCSISNITLSGEQTIDGVAVVANDRVLVTGQTDATENGIYIADSGAWSRAPDWDGANDVVTGTTTRAHSGTSNSGYWIVTTTGTITPGTTSVAFDSSGALGDFSDATSDTNGDYLVAFKQSKSGTALTGAIAKTVHDKLEDYVNLFDFMTAAQIADVRAGTLLVDVSAAVQACIDAVLAAPLINPRIYAPDGHYRIESTVTLGLLSGARTSGLVFFGAGIKSTEFVWFGGTGGTMFDCPALWSATLSDFRLRGDAVGGVPTIGIDLNGGTNSGGKALLSNVNINNCDIGLYIGSTVTSEDSLPSNAFLNLDIGNCTTAAIRIYGNDTDGQHFYNLATSNNAVNIWGTGCRSVFVYGGGHSNPTGTGLGYSAFVYMKLDGVLGQGAYGLENLRIEGGVTVLECGNLSGTGNADAPHLYFRGSNLYQTSVHQDNYTGTSPKILHAGISGSFIFENCHFPGPRQTFDFPNVCRTNRQASLFLRGCGFSEDTPDIEVFGNFINVNGNGGGGAFGGLKLYMEGCVAIDGAPFGSLDSNSNTAFRDRRIRVTPDDADFQVRNISAITNANPAKVTTTASHGYSTGDVINIIEVVGMEELNQRVFTITVVDATNFTLDGENSTGYGTYSSAGQTTKPRFSDLDGEEAEVLSGLTAYPTGGQTYAIVMSARINQISTVASAGDSVKLRPAVARIATTIINDGANACDVFPHSGDDLGAGVDTAVSLAAGSSITYVFDGTNYISY